MAWYSAPFQKHHRYRVKKGFSELGHTFVEGEILEFVDDSYDAKGGVIRFWFQEQNSHQSKAWHVWENDTEILRKCWDYFEEQ